MPVWEHETLGRLEIEGPEVARQGKAATWKFVYTVGREPIRPGGGIEIVFATSYPTATWSLPQTADPTAPGYVTAQIDGAGWAEVSVIPVPRILRPYSLCAHIVRVTVREATLFTRDRIIVTYGDTSCGAPGSIPPALAVLHQFPVYVDTSGGHGGSALLAQHSWFRVVCRLAPLRKVAHIIPTIPVAGGQAARLKVVAPSVVRPNATFTVRISPLDQWANLAGDYSGQVRLMLAAGPGKLSAQEQFELTSEAAPAEVKAKLGGPGVYYLAAVDPASGLAGMSNPIVVDQRLPRVYWGEIHAHTELSDGVGSLDEHYDHARRAALLDVAATCDHCTTAEGEAGEEKWLLTKQAADRHYQRRKFVTLYAYEPVFRLDDSRAHISVYTINPDAPLIVTADNDQVFDDALRHGYVIVPHHTGYGAPNLRLLGWPALDHPEAVPVCEIFSAHGCSEAPDAPKPLVDQTEGSFWRDALEQGLQLGAIAASDYHSALCGQDIDLSALSPTLNCRHFQYRCGYTAFLARELTREGIMDCFRRRACYATTGARIWLHVKAGAGMMGEVVEGGSGRLTMTIAAAGTAPIQRVDIIGQGGFCRTIDGDGQSTTLRTTVQLPAEPRGWFYVRILQADGEMAWSSPVWIGRSEAD